MVDDEVQGIPCSACGVLGIVLAQPGGTWYCEECLGDPGFARVLAAAAGTVTGVAKRMSAAIH